MKSNMNYRMGQLNNKGFTLIEVLIAMSVLVIVSVPLLDTLSGATVMTRKASNRQRATLTAQTISEGVKRYSTKDLNMAFSDSGSTPDNFPILNRSQYRFEEFDRLRWDEDCNEYEVYNVITENSKEYTYGIYGIETGVARYDALITLDSEEYKDINADVIPEIVNIGAPGTGLIDITGVYNGEDIVGDLKEYINSDGDGKSEAFRKEGLRVEVDVVIRKNTTPEVSYEVYGNVKYTYTYLDGGRHIVEKDYIGSRTMDNIQKLNYVYVLLGDADIHDLNQLNFYIKADETENIPIAIVTGDNDLVKWNMNVVEYAEGMDIGGGVPDGPDAGEVTYKWRDAVMFFTNAEERKINFRNRVIAEAMKDYGTSGNKLKRIYDLEVKLFPFEEDLADKYKGEPIDQMKSSYLRIDVEDFNDESSRSE